MMYRKAIDLMDRLYHVRVGTDSLKNTAKIGSIAGLAIAGADVLSRAVSKISAYAAFDSSGLYHCSGNVALEKSDYINKIVGTENYISHYMSAHAGQNNSQWIFNYLANSIDLDTIWSMRKCLDSNNINPDSIVSLSPMLNKIVAIPEFGPIAAGVTAAGILAGILIPKYLRKH